MLKAFFAADIPLNKLRGKEAYELFNKLGHDFPSESSAWAYLPAHFSVSNIAKLLEKIINRNVYLVNGVDDVRGVRNLNMLG